MPLPLFLGPGVPIPLAAAAPGGGPAAGASVLNFNMQAQQQEQWCWAAVAASVSAFYSPPANWVQCTIAGACLNQDCCTDPSACNRTGDLDQALQKTGNYINILPTPLPFTAVVGLSVTEEIDRQRVIGCRIGWEPGTDDLGHFTVIYGYDSANQDLDIGDPYYGPDVAGPAYGPYLTLPYDQFVQGYQSYPTARWTDYYPTKGSQDAA